MSEMVGGGKGRGGGSAQAMGGVGGGEGIVWKSVSPIFRGVGGVQGLKKPCLVLWCVKGGLHSEFWG